MIVRKLLLKSANLVNHEINKIIIQYQELDFKTITTDTDVEFSKLGELNCIEGVFYIDSYSSHERGMNKYFNGLLRELSP